MGIRLTESDRAMLAGASGEAVRFAMTIILQMAEITGAEDLRSIEAAHIDACALRSPSSLEFIERMVEGEGRFRVPTTLSMVSLDLRHWRDLGVPKDFAASAKRIANAYRTLGGIPVWTCAPYQGYLTPRFGQHVAWGESNAVAYANSVLGARTNRCADYMDVCAALTGRVPNVGLHCTENRAGDVLIRVEGTREEAWQHPEAWAALGHWVGEQVGSRIPVIEGLPRSAPNDGLKAFAAAVASAGGVALFHLTGITPEAPDTRTAFQGRDPVETFQLTPGSLAQSWESLSTPGSSRQNAPIDTVIVGCPHTSFTEFEALAGAIHELGDAHIHPDTQFLVITHETSHALAIRAGLIEPLESFGATIVFDTCPFHSPIVRTDARAIMTNSGKCAYYAPGELQADVVFGTLRACVRSAAEGRVMKETLEWMG